VSDIGAAQIIIGIDTSGTDGNLFRWYSDSIDASFVGLKGGTTGQVLSKTSGTDLAFTWVAQDDSNAIQNAIVDAKGDLIAATANDTPARLAVGSNGTVLTADSAEATGLKWATPAAATGSFVFINRTTFSNVASQAIDNVFSTTYQKYFVTLDNMSAATSNDDPQLQFRYAGPTTQTAAYYSGVEQISWTGANSLNQVANGSAINMSNNTGGSSNEQGSAYLFFSNVGITTAPTVIINYVSGQKNVANGFGVTETARTYTGFLLKSASTNISGTVTVYGLANS
jgi:hypothetical protein